MPDEDGMVDIIFKAKRLDSGRWVKGVPVRIGLPDETLALFIVREIFIGSFNGRNPVDPLTLCQYTGGVDINGKQAFFGDLVTNGKFTTVIKRSTSHGGLAMGFDSGAECVLTYAGLRGLAIVGSIHDDNQKQQKEKHDTVHG